MCWPIKNSDTVVIKLGIGTFGMVEEFPTTKGLSTKESMKLSKISAIIPIIQLLVHIFLSHFSLSPNFPCTCLDTAFCEHPASSNAGCQIQWCKAHKHWTFEQWRHVLWRDKLNFTIWKFDGREWVWQMTK